MKKASKKPTHIPVLDGSKFEWKNWVGSASASDLDLSFEKVPVTIVLESHRTGNVVSFTLSDKKWFTDDWSMAMGDLYTYKNAAGTVTLHILDEVF